jgi:hypothetical protein
MQDGPNMSYCAFENTAAAMKQLVDIINDAIDSDRKLDFSSQWEQRYFDDLEKICAKLLLAKQDYLEFVEGVEPETENDGD